MSKRLLIDVEAKEDTNNKYLPETQSAGGAVATGGELSIDAVTVETESKSIATFDMATLSYPLTVTHVALVKVDGTGAGTIFDGTVTNSSWANQGDAASYLEATIGGAVAGIGSGELEAVVDTNDDVLIQSTANGDFYGGDTFELYIRTADQPQFRVECTGVNDTYQGDFDITIEGTTYSISYQLSSGISLADVLTTIKQTLNGETVTTGVSTTITPSTLSGFVADSNATQLLINRTDSSALDFTANVDNNTNNGGLTITAEDEITGREFTEVVSTGNALNTDSIQFDLGATTLVTYLQSNGDYDNTLDANALYKDLKDSLNALTNFTPDGVKIEGTGTLDVFVTGVGGVGDNLTVSIGGESDSIADTADTTTALLTELTNLLNGLPNIAVVDDGVDKVTITPVVGEDIDTGVLEITSSTSTFSSTQGGATETTFQVPLGKLLLETTTQVAVYNNETPAINVVGDGSVTTSGAVALTNGTPPITGITGQLATIAKRRKTFIDGEIKLQGFGGYILVNEFPTNFTTQDEVLSVANNVTSVSTGNGLGFEDLYKTFNSTDPYYNVLFKVNEDGSGNRSISNTPSDHIVFKIWRSSGGYLNMSRVYFDNPMKSVSNGWEFTAQEDVILDDSDLFITPEQKFFVVTYPEYNSGVLALSLNTNDGGNIGTNIVSKIASGATIDQLDTDLKNSIWVRGVLANDTTDIILDALKTEGD